MSAAPAPAPAPAPAALPPPPLPLAATGPAPPLPAGAVLAAASGPGEQNLRNLSNALNTSQARNGQSINAFVNSISGKVRALLLTGEEILRKIARIDASKVDADTVRRIIEDVNRFKTRVRDKVRPLDTGIDSLTQIFAQIDADLEAKLQAAVAAGAPGAAAVPRAGGPDYEPPTGLNLGSYGSASMGGAAPAPAPAPARRAGTAPAPAEQRASLKTGVTAAEAQAAYDAYIAANAAFDAYAATAVQRRGKAANRAAMMAITQEENRLQGVRDAALNRYKGMVNLPGATWLSSGTIVPPQQGGRRTRSKSRSRSKKSRSNKSRSNKSRSNKSRSNKSRSKKSRSNKSRSRR